MTVVQRFLNAIHRLVSGLNKDDEDRPVYTDEQLGEVACGAVEGALRPFFKADNDDQTRVV